MNTTIHKVTRYGLCFLNILLISIGVLLEARAQNAPPDATHAKLATLVHLRLGQTTLAKVVTALSEQTGLTIQATHYLNEHKLIVQMDSIRAQDALDALATLNGWTWYRTEPGHYALTRSKIRLPRQIAEIPAALSQALPKEIRRYLGFGVSLKEQAPLSDPDKRAELENSAQTDKWLGTYDTKLFQASIGAKVGPLLGKQRAILLEMVTPDIFDGRKIRYAQMKAEEQQALLRSFVLEALMGIADERQLLAFSGNLLPFQRDLTLAEISLQNGNTIQIGTSWIAGKEQRFVGFGTSLEPEPAPAKPMLPQFP